jgi:hypothetical protein
VESPEPWHCRWIKELKLKKSKKAPYRMSTEGARVGSQRIGLSGNYMAFAEEQGIPQDLMCRVATVPNNIAVSNTEEYDSDSSMAWADKENIGSR